MHATVDDLLKLRDRGHVADAELVAHMRSCEECRDQFARLKRTTQVLRELPDRVRAPDRWHAIQEQLRAPVRIAEPERSRPGWWLPAASAAAVVIAVLLTLKPAVPPDTSGAPAQTQVAGNVPDETRSPTAELGNAGPAQLIAESQRLEEVLSAYAAPRTTRASTALTVADLEERIQWVDYRLNVGVEEGIDSAQSQKLWRERVELLNSLVAVRYAEARTLAF